MSSEAMADIGPSMPSQGKIITHARDTIEYARNAIRCAEQRDHIDALHWMDRARRAANFTELEEVKDD
jgi:hypothetical protein